MRSLLLLCVAVLFLSAPHVSSEAPPTSTCKPSGEGCSRQALRSALQDARTIATQAPHLDRFSEAQLARLVTGLGKQVAKPHAAADITLILAAPEPTGIDIGPAYRELATLRVFSGRDGQLLWVERLSGPGDRPWPAIVDELLTNLKTTLATPIR